MATNSNLKFPGKLLCIEKQKALDHNLLIISDTGNNRIVLINEETLECIGTIGTGKVGLVDGNYDEASFHHP
jgi:type V secretory pathway adhesin AidA